MAIYKIRLELEQDESGAYTVTSPDVPGLLTAGYTPEEIAHNVQEVITDLIEIWQEEGTPLPPALRPEQSFQPIQAVHYESLVIA